MQKDEKQWFFPTPYRLFFVFELKKTVCFLPCKPPSKN